MSGKLDVLRKSIVTLALSPERCVRTCIVEAVKCSHKNDDRNISTMLVNSSQKHQGTLYVTSNERRNERRTKLTLTVDQEKKYELKRILSAHAGRKRLNNVKVISM